jgi:hypothetical protein
VCVCGGGGGGASQAWQATAAGHGAIVANSHVIFPCATVCRNWGKMRNYLVFHRGKLNGVLFQLQSTLSKTSFAHQII